MLKISEVAKKLGVESYLIFERITLDSDIFKKYIHKIHSVRYIDEEGVVLLQKMIDGTLEKENALNEIGGLEGEEEILNTTSPYFSSTQDENVNKSYLKREQSFLKKSKKIDDECICLENEIKKYRQKLVFLDEKLMRIENSLSDYFNRILNT